jgi:hypothetical protein
MYKGGNLSHACIVLSVVCLFFAGITEIIHAQETIPEIKKTDSAILSDDSLATINDPDTIRRSNIVFPADNDSVPAYNPDASPPLFYNDDSVSALFPDSVMMAITNENAKNVANKDATTFKPNPKTAYLMAAIFPGFGQIYNRQYWKLPIVYGGFVGFIYAISWNNKNLQDYSNAYFDIKRDYAEYIKDPASSAPENWSQNWKDFTNPNRDPATYLTDTNFHNQLKSGKDFYRRYRDLSIILSVAFYLICMADSYVDAQMFDFDVSPDLSFRVAPELLPATMCTSRSFGLNVCMIF